MEKKPIYRCSWDICNKRLFDFGFICSENGSVYCSEICADRDLQDKTEKKGRFLWN